MTRKPKRGDRPTESKYESGTRETYVAYDLEQATRGAAEAVSPN